MFLAGRSPESNLSVHLTKFNVWCCRCSPHNAQHFDSRWEGSTSNPSFEGVSSAKIAAGGGWRSKPETHHSNLTFKNSEMFKRFWGVIKMLLEYDKILKVTWNFVKHYQQKGWKENGNGFLHCSEACRRLWVSAAPTLNFKMKHTW